MVLIKNLNIKFRPTILNISRVSQGPVLGPLLFTRLIKECSIKLTSISANAHDTQLIHTQVQMCV
jgi:hypothetical protein